MAGEGQYPTVELQHFSILGLPARLYDPMYHEERQRAPAASAGLAFFNRHGGLRDWPLGNPERKYLPSLPSQFQTRNVRPPPASSRVRPPDPHQSRHPAPAPQPVLRKRPALPQYRVVYRTLLARPDPFSTFLPSNHPTPEAPHRQDHLPYRNPLRTDHQPPLLQRVRHLFHVEQLSTPVNSPPHLVFPSCEGQKVEDRALYIYRAPPRRPRKPPPAFTNR